MLDSLSNDRKVILKSAIVGLILIALCTTLLPPKDTSLQAMAILGVIATYWFIPTWFSRNRQLEIKEIKYSIPKSPKSKELKVLTYQYFNADGKEVTPWPPAERLICLVVTVAIPLFLFFSTLVFKQPLQILINYFPNHEKLFIFISIYLVFTAPYLVRHSFYFKKDLPIDTAFTLTFVGGGSSYSSASSGTNSISLDHFTSGKYSYLSYNSNNHRNY